MKYGPIFAAFLLGCTVKAGNPGDGTKSKIEGIALNMEDRTPASGEVEVFHGQNRIGTFPIESSGAFHLSGLEPGLYSLVLGEARRVVSVERDLAVELLVPSPAKPGNPRLYRLPLGGACLLWEDRSGLEDGFNIGGSIVATAPKNAWGMILEGYGDENKKILVSAFNAFGQSSQVPSDFSQYDSLVSTPTDRRRCLESTRVGAFLLP